MMNDLKLGSREEIVYNYLIDLINNKEKQTVNQISQTLSVAPSTVIKVTKKLGYSGWNDMFYQSVNNHASVVPLDFNNFKFLDFSESSEKISLICEMIKKYRGAPIVIFSIGDTELVATWLAKKLLNKGYLAFANTYYLSLKNCNFQPGISIFICESGMSYIDIKNEYVEHDYLSVSITSNQKTPLAMQSHISVEIKNNKNKTIKQYEPDYFASRVLIFFELVLKYL